MSSTELSRAEQTKFGLLAEGMTIEDQAYEFLRSANRDRRLTPADYASTSGLILRLGDDVWVNAPIAAENPNFVNEPRFRLVLEDDGLAIEDADTRIPAKFWIAPTFHEGANLKGEPYTSYGYTHTDRVRVSPVEGCAMTCKFCDLPYEFRYRTKTAGDLLDTARVALDDPTQPAAHVLISGGTPKSADYEYLRECYEVIVGGLDEPVDIMMVPLDEVMDPEWLDRIGVNAISMNIEIFNRELSRKLMRRKHDQGLDHYLDSLERAGELLGDGRVRSMLMVGLEPVEDTLAGVEAISQRGCVPVLSPFRPDESTPMRNEAPPSAAVLEDVYLRALEITRALDIRLGPECIPCSHNTLTLAASGLGDADVHHGHPNLG